MQQSGRLEHVFLTALSVGAVALVMFVLSPPASPSSLASEEELSCSVDPILGGMPAAPPGALAMRNVPVVVTYCLRVPRLACRLTIVVRSAASRAPPILA